MSVTVKDARAVLATILKTFAIYVCEGHDDSSGPTIGETAQCNGMCRLSDALNPRDTDMPTLYDHNQGEVSKGNWSIAWEGGSAPEDWTSNELLARNIREATGGRVHVEAINNCILGIYSA